MTNTLQSGFNLYHILLTTFGRLLSHEWSLQITNIFIPIIEILFFLYNVNTKYYVDFTWLDNLTRNLHAHFVFRMQTFAQNKFQLVLNPRMFYFISWKLLNRKFCSLLLSAEKDKTLLMTLRNWHIRTGHNFFLFWYFDRLQFNN